MTALQWLYLVLADLVLVVHFAFVAFIILGLALIWIGWFRGWTFVRNLWFRASHLAAMGVVVAESAAGFVCPLTVWEDRLRFLAGGEQRYQESFIQHWLHQVIFLDVEPRIFTVFYLAFFLVLVLSFWFVPPHWPRRSRSTTG